MLGPNRNLSRDQHVSMDRMLRVIAFLPCAPKLLLTLVGLLLISVVIRLLLVLFLPNIGA